LPCLCILGTQEIEEEDDDSPLARSADEVAAMRDDLMEVLSAVLSMHLLPPEEPEVGNQGLFKTRATPLYHYNCSWCQAATSSPSQRVVNLKLLCTEVCSRSGGDARRPRGDAVGGTCCRRRSLR
jgi:hypothetical protein